MEHRPLSLSEKVSLVLFGVIAAAILLPGVVLIAVSLFSTGAINLPHDLSF